MNLQLQQYIPWNRSQPNRDISGALSSSGIILEEPKQKATVGAKFWQWSLLSLVPWVFRTRDKFQLPTTVSRKLKKHSRSRGNVESAAQYKTIRFKPYVSKVPWHTGPRGFLSQLFPRYGIIVVLTGQVGKTEALLFGTNVQLIGWISVATVMIWDMILMIKQSF